ncbi:MAG: O-acetyl-ADP-ribose deacetylase [Acidobacteria bacterium]|nr:O-acetyl-ADP-ribose deacetylase [Acidobacteriota bacterium]
MVHELPNGNRLQLLAGDITKVPVDAMANAANSGLRGGGGVDGAIHRAGGPAIMSELDAIRARQGGCATGSAVATTAGSLPAKYVLHAVGPVYRDGKSGEPELLASSYRACLRLAEERALDSLSFPSISTGVYGYPVKDAAEIALATVLEHLRSHRHPRQVIFVLFGDEALHAYERSLRHLGAAHGPDAR